MHTPFKCEHITTNYSQATFPTINTHREKDTTVVHIASHAKKVSVGKQANTQTFVSTITVVNFVDFL